MTAVAPVPVPVEDAAAPIASLRTSRLVALLAAHGVLGLLALDLPSVATLHAVGSIGALFVVALDSRLRRRFPVVAAYVASSEALWRVGGASVPWETAKLSLVAAGVVAVLASGRVRRPQWPLVFIAALVPATVVTITSRSFGFAREAISFNLAAAIALGVLFIAFQRAPLRDVDVRSLLLALVAPAIAVGASASLALATATRIEFGASSNLASSAGFGPNQVSAALGLGALAAMLVAIVSPGISPPARGVLLLASVYCSGTSALTFSRSGLYGTGIGLVVGVLVLPARRDQRRRALAIGLGTLLLAGWVVAPRLDSFTDGALGARFSNTSSTHRSTLAREDLDMFTAEPLVGVGVGASPDLRPSGHNLPHTEYTRLLAEHGVPGLLALFALLQMIRTNLRRVPIDRRTIAWALVAWGLSYMAANGLRLASPALALAVVAALGATPVESRR